MNEHAFEENVMESLLNEEFNDLKDDMSRD
jgi:hypothetical protein